MKWWNHPTILAANDHSLIQALTFKYKNSNFFGVQYHPEFEVSDMVFILRYMKDTLMAEGLFENNILLEKLSSSTTKNGILPSDISDYSQHIQEVKCWLNNLEIRD